jgi:hypothetical protein
LSAFERSPVTLYKSSALENDGVRKMMSGTGSEVTEGAATGAHA